MPPNPGPAITNTPQTKAVMAPVNTMGQQNALPAEMNACRLLGLYRGVNANAANTDHPIPILNAERYSVFQVVATNASISLTTATGGLFSDVGGGGTAVVRGQVGSGWLMTVQEGAELVGVERAAAHSPHQVTVQDRTGRVEAHQDRQKGDDRGQHDGGDAEYQEEQALLLFGNKVFVNEVEVALFEHTISLWV